TTSLRVITRFFATGVDVNNFLNFKSTLLVGDIWLSFCIAGFIIGAFYALGLKTKIWPMVWRGGIGFGLGSLLGPIIGNLFGNLFNSLLASYLIAFAVIGAILGLFLAWGAYINIKNQKSKLQTKI
ncbi:MAG: hypothetical protein COZ98_03805, partial [Candidatus Omnitrophica bacterium CG_4_8_14_3_um_filter_43_15]